MAGFGPVHLLPGIWNSATVNTAITLPIGAEVYGAYSVGAWLSKRAKRFAKWSAWGSMILGTFGQVSYHDQVTPIIERSLAEIARMGREIPGTGTVLAIESRDLLDDLSEVTSSDTGPVRLADMPPRLRKLAPTWGPYAIRSRLATAARHGIGALDALTSAFQGQPWTPETG